MKTVVHVLLGCAIGLPSAASASCLTEVADFAVKICGEIDQSGVSTVVDTNGNVDVGVSNIIKRVVGLDAKLNGHILYEAYTDVARSELGPAKFNVLQCRQKMVDVAVAQVCRETPPPPPPPPPPPVNPACNTVAPFDIQVVPTKDGNGNVVGTLGPNHIDVYYGCANNEINSTRYRLSYRFYNGSGTWRGSQSFTLNFTFRNNARQDSSAIGLDRGHCIYGGSEPHTFEGSLDPLNGIVSGVGITVNGLSGVQTRC